MFSAGCDADGDEAVAGFAANGDAESSKFMLGSGCEEEEEEEEEDVSPFFHSNATTFPSIPFQRLFRLSLFQSFCPCPCPDCMLLLFLLQALDQMNIKVGGLCGSRNKRPYPPPTSLFV